MTEADVPFGLSPRPRVYGIFAHSGQMEALRRSIAAVGLTAANMPLLEGQSGIEALDLSGEQGGKVEKFLRFV